MTGNAANLLLSSAKFIFVHFFSSIYIYFIEKKMNRALQVLAERNLRLMKPVARNFATSSTKLSGQ
jgi:hypothetical protein